MGGTQEVRDGNWQSSVPEVGRLTDLLVLPCSPLRVTLQWLIGLVRSIPIRKEEKQGFYCGFF